MMNSFFQNMNSTVANDEVFNAALVLGDDGTAQTFTLTDPSSC